MLREDIIKNAMKVHGDIYDYSLVKDIRTNKDKIDIICRKHGIFQQSYHNHVNNKMHCKQCGYEKQKINKTNKVSAITQDEYIARLTSIHGNRFKLLNQFTKLENQIEVYDYYLMKNNTYIAKDLLMKKSKYKPNTLIQSYIDKISEYNILQICNIDKIINKDDPVEILHTELNIKILLKKVSYILNSKIMESLINIDINDFSYSRYYKVLSKPKQLPDLDINSSTSVLENILLSYLNEVNSELIALGVSPIKYIQNDKSVLNGKELDFYFPDDNLAIELNGNYWHSDIKLEHNIARTHMYNKYLQCKDLGIQLLNFYEDEVINKPDIVWNIIKHRLNINTNRVYARNCKVRLIGQDVADEFYDTYHLQGKTTKGINLGLYRDDILLACMSFSYLVSNRGTTRNYIDFELIRFASKDIVIGGASKLLSYFIKVYKPESIVSYSDNRISNGNMYTTLNFIKEKDVRIDYYYIHKSNVLIRRHKSFLTKAKLKTKFPDNYNDSLSEYENARNNNYYRIWNCGLIKWKIELN